MTRRESGRHVQHRLVVVQEIVKSSKEGLDLLNALPCSTSVREREFGRVHGRARWPTTCRREAAFRLANCAIVLLLRV
jgi:hypothetical protein